MSEYRTKVVIRLDGDGWPTERTAERLFEVLEDAGHTVERVAITNQVVDLTGPSLNYTRGALEVARNHAKKNG